MTDGALEAESQEFERKRAEATAAIVESTASKKLVIAGPGTGKTHTFAEALRAAGQGGLAITFIRNLVADLSDSLGELADVFTFHGFCKHLLHRHPVEGLREGWDYYPPLLELIEYDLGLLGNRTTRKQLEAGLHNLDDPHGAVAAAMDLGNYYNAVSHTDLVYRVLHHFQQNADLVPTYPLIVSPIGERLGAMALGVAISPISTTSTDRADVDGGACFWRAVLPSRRQGRLGVAERTDPARYRIDGAPPCGLLSFARSGTRAAKAPSPEK